LLDRGMQVFTESLDELEGMIGPPRAVGPAVGHLPHPSPRSALADVRLPAPRVPEPGAPPPGPHLDGE
jgi:hypothetical protein